MKIIISESQYRLLNENYQHDRDEMVDFRNIDLQYEYDKHNILLFDNKLPRIKIRWSMAKNSHGVLKTMRSRLTGKIVNMEMSLSKFFAVPYYAFTDTLAHEMIHVFQQINGVREMDGGHGPVFYREASRINSMGLGFNITKTKDSSKLSTSSFVKPKTRIVLLSNFDGVDRLHIMTESAFVNSVQDLIELFDYLTKNKYNEIIGKFYKVNIPQIEKYHINRKISGLRGYTLKLEGSLTNLIDDIVNSEYVISIESKDGKTKINR